MNEPAFVRLIPVIGKLESTCIVPTAVGQHVWILYMGGFRVSPNLLIPNLSPFQCLFLFQDFSVGPKQNTSSETENFLDAHQRRAYSFFLVPFAQSPFVLVFLLSLLSQEWHDNNEAQKQLKTEEPIKCLEETLKAAFCILASRSSAQ